MNKYLHIVNYQYEDGTYILHYISYPPHESKYIYKDIVILDVWRLHQKHPTIIIDHDGQNGQNSSQVFLIIIGTP